jgi:hypothetical protein
MNFQSILILLVGAVSTLGCSSSSDNPTGTSGSSANVINQVYSSLQSAAPDFTTARSLARVQDGEIQAMAAIGTNLSTTSVFPSVENPGSLSMTGMEYLNVLLGASTDNSVFTRAKTPFLISCTVDALAAKGDALYSTAQTSFVLSSAVVGPCGSESDYNGGGGSLIGSTVTLSIADLVDTTNYDQLITMPGGSNPQFGGNDQYIYVRNNTTDLNFLHVEINAGNTSFSINSLHYNKTNKSGYFQYVSASTGGGQYAYRIYMNPTANSSRVFVSWKMTNAPAHTILALIGSTFENQTSAALSMSVTGLGGATAFDNANACINISVTPPTVSTDDTLVCGTQTLAGAVGAVGVNSIPTAVASLAAGTIRTWASTPGTGATKFPSFSDTTIASAGLGF